MARALLKEGFGKATPIARNLLTGVSDQPHRGLLSRFTDGVRSEISTIDASTWMSPAQPMRRVAPPGTLPRIWDYRFGQNIDYSPKGGEGVTFDTLRNMVDSFDLLAMVIETRKDQVARVPHSFTVKEQPGEPASKQKERQNEDKRILMLTEFFRRPDGIHSFYDWQRMILDDMFVIDAPAILPRWRRDGGLYGFDVIDGSTISLLVDDAGRTPMAPDPAYRQIIKGLPAVDMMQPDPNRPGTDQLFYCPRNVRTHFLYGFSPVEQVILTVNLGLRREISQLQYYTDGTIPDIFLEAPDGMTEDRIQQLETMWNEKFATTAARRKANFIPYGTSVTFAKDPKLKDELDEYIARKIAYAFSVSPTALVKMVNRAAGQQMSEDAKAEGLEPVLYWFKELMDSLLDFMNCPDIEYSNGSYLRENPLQQAQIHEIYVTAVDSEGRSIMTADEVRDDLGLEPLPEIIRDDQGNELDANGKPKHPLPPAPVIAGADGDPKDPNADPDKKPGFESKAAAKRKKKLSALRLARNLPASSRPSPELRVY